MTTNQERALPRPEDVPVGKAWLIAYEGGFHTALKADSRDSEPWVVSFSPDGGFVWLSDRDVTLISRLVPEIPRKTLVTVEDYRDAPVGTIVRHARIARYQVFQKWDNDEWFGTLTGGDDPWSDSDISAIPREVIWEQED